MRIPFVVLSAGLILAACSSRPPDPVDPNARQLVLHYDANKDGIVTQAEIDAGLASEFAAADTNHDGQLDPAEVAAINDARWLVDASRTSPLQDWNNDGFIDAREFATEVRSAFNALDRNKDGQVSGDELSVPQGAGRGGRGAGPGGRGGPPGGGRGAPN